MDRCLRPALAEDQVEKAREGLVAFGDGTLEAPRTSEPPPIDRCPGQADPLLLAENRSNHGQIRQVARS